VSISEQELFGLMAIAQEQQKAAALALEQLETQRTELDRTISRAKAAVLEMEKAGHTSALIIEKATRNAVSKAVEGALNDVCDKTKATIGNSVGPAVRALEGATGRAEKAGDDLQEAASSISWKWAGIWTLTSCVLLAAVVGLAMLLIPTPGQIADLRANAEYLEAKGGKVNLTYCGPTKRLCVEIDPKADTWGENRQFRVLKGY